MASGCDVVLFTSDGGRNWVRSQVGVMDVARSGTGSRVPAVVCPAVAVRSVPLSCSLPTGGDASAAIFDCLGRRVRTLFAGRRGPGRFELTWDGRDARGHPMPTGAYFCRLESRLNQAVGRFILVE